ncbi:MAG TPA: hypothetical protein VF786_14275 [Terriglobales bacterium]
MQIADVVKALTNQHPLLIAFDILTLVAVLGCLWMLMREAVLFRGYRSLRKVAKAMAYGLNGSTFRDGTDLVINGFYRGVPTVVRFSFAENTPEVNVWMKVASALTMFASHKSAKLLEGRTRVLTRNSWFDERFVLRTDNTDDLAALLTDDRAFKELKNLCCSPGTAVALNRDSLEISEQTIPVPNTFKHLMAHLDSMAEMAVRVGALSNLKHKAKIYVPDRYLIARAALLLLILAGGFELYSAMDHYGEPQQTAYAGISNTEPMSEEEAQIPGRLAWRLATASDFDPGLVAWMHDHGMEPNGRIHAHFEGTEDSHGTGYVYVQRAGAPSTEWRIVMMSEKKRVYDATFRGLTAVMLAQKDSIAHQQSDAGDSQPPSPDGDGLLLIGKNGDTPFATVLYSSGGKIQTQRVSDYYSLAMR